MTFLEFAVGVSERKERKGKKKIDPRKKEPAWKSLPCLEHRAWDRRFIPTGWVAKGSYSEAKRFRLKLKPASPMSCEHLSLPNHHVDIDWRTRER